VPSFPDYLYVSLTNSSAEPSDNYFQADSATAGPGDGLSLRAVALDSHVLRPDDGAAVPAGHT
jgi:hypothetical protein